MCCEFFKKIIGHILQKSYKTLLSRLIGKSNVISPLLVHGRVG